MFPFAFHPFNVDKQREGLIAQLRLAACALSDVVEVKHLPELYLGLKGGNHRRNVSLRVSQHEIYLMADLPPLKTEHLCPFRLYQRFYILNSLSAKPITD